MKYRTCTKICTKTADIMKMLQTRFSVHPFSCRQYFLSVLALPRANVIANIFYFLAVEKFDSSRTVSPIEMRVCWILLLQCALQTMPP